MLTVFDNENETWPVFFGKATRLDHGFNDPAVVEGSAERQMPATI